MIKNIRTINSDERELYIAQSQEYLNEVKRHITSKKLFEALQALNEQLSPDYDERNNYIFFQNKPLSDEANTYRWAAKSAYAQLMELDGTDYKGVYFVLSALEIWYDNPRDNPLIPIPLWLVWNENIVRLQNYCLNELELPQTNLHA